MPLPPFDTFQSKGLDPYVIMAKLEGTLTGQDYRVITAGSHSHYGRMVPERATQGPWVTKVSSPLQAALAQADSGKLARAAAEWSQAEELGGASPEDLTWAKFRIGGTLQGACLGVCRSRRIDLRTNPVW